jgi:hypothetical protein
VPWETNLARFIDDDLKLKVLCVKASRVSEGAAHWWWAAQILYFGWIWVFGFWLSEFCANFKTPGESLFPTQLWLGDGVFY